MELRNIKLALANFTNGGPAIVTDVKPAYDFDKVTKQINREKIVGTKVTVTLPKNNYDKLTVTVSGPDTLSARINNGETDIAVDFEGFTASIYSMRGDDGKFRVGVSAKASKVVDAADFIDLGSDS